MPSWSVSVHNSSYVLYSWYLHSHHTRHFVPKSYSTHPSNHSHLHSLQCYFGFSLHEPRFTPTQHTAPHACRINLPTKLQEDIFNSKGYRRSQLKPATVYSSCHHSIRITIRRIGPVAFSPVHVIRASLSSDVDTDTLHRYFDKKVTGVYV